MVNIPKKINISREWEDVLSPDFYHSCLEWQDKLNPFVKTVHDVYTTVPKNGEEKRKLLLIKIGLAVGLGFCALGIAAGAFVGGIPVLISCKLRGRATSIQTKITEEQIQAAMSKKPEPDFTNQRRAIKILNTVAELFFKLGLMLGTLPSIPGLFIGLPITVSSERAYKKNEAELKKE